MSKDFEEKMLSMQKALLSLKIRETKMPLIDQVRLLKSVGLDYKEIASIVGTTPNSVSVMFAKINKGK